MDIAPGAPRGRQRVVLAWLLLSYLAAALLYLLWAPLEAPVAAPGLQATPSLDLPRWQLMAANGAAILVLYTPLGYAGLWLARRLDLPGIFPEGFSLKGWALGPLLVGLGAGVLLVVVDQVLARVAQGTPFPHPAFPVSLLASYTAAVGEEILFRLFFLSLWAVLWHAALRPLVSAPRARLWALGLANGIAAVAFALGHLGTAIVLFGVASPVELPGAVLGELLVLNGIVGILAGVWFVRAGLVGAVGVHLGADLVWHVLYGLV